MLLTLWLLHSNSLHKRNDDCKFNKFNTHRMTFGPNVPLDSTNMKGRFSQCRYYGLLWNVLWESWKECVLWRCSPMHIDLEILFCCQVVTKGLIIRLDVGPSTFLSRSFSWKINYQSWPNDQTHNISFYDITWDLFVWHQHTLLAHKLLLRKIVM